MGLFPERAGHVKTSGVEQSSVLKILTVICSSGGGAHGVIQPRNGVKRLSKSYTRKLGCSDVK